MKKLVILAILTLSGCQTFSQLSPEKQAVQRAKFEKNCQEFGLQSGTIPFDECIQKSIEAFDQGTITGNKKAEEEVGDDLFGAS